MSISDSRLYRTLLLGVMIGLTPVGNMAAAQRAIPYDNLAYPVLITLKNGSTGSGFYLKTGQAIYLVTAKHVLFDLGSRNGNQTRTNRTATRKLLDVAAELLSYSSDSSDSTLNLVTLDLSALQNDGNIKAHPSEDVAVVKIVTLTETSISHTAQLRVPGVIFKVQPKGGLAVADLGVVKPFDQVLTGNEVMVFGYPTSLGLQQLPQIDMHRPLLRRGIVAGTNPETRSIILDCPSYFGNSGGLVLELDTVAPVTRFYVIGVISQYVPFADTGRSFIMLTNSGYSIATPMDFVLDLVR